MPTVDGPGYGLPEKQGLYDPRLESEACGVGFVVSIDGIKSHKVYVWFVRQIFATDSVSEVFLI